MLDQCDSCKSTGLPLLPLRYAPVPATVAQKLPDWAKGHKVVNADSKDKSAASKKNVQKHEIDIGPDYHYALRSIRGGYIYIYHTKHPEGANHWECFSVTHDGKVRKQPSPDFAVPPEFDGKCTRKNHSDVRMEFLVIAQAHKCTDSWIAFSEHKWTENTRKKYQTDKTLREARMQAINPAALLANANGGNPHAAQADTNNIGAAIEYSPTFDPISFVCNGPLGMITKGEDGSYDEAKVIKQTSLYPLNRRNASRLFAPMRSHGITEDGQPTSGVVFALWDAVGAAHELNGFRNEVAGNASRYGDELKKQIDALNNIDALENILRKRAESAVDRADDNTKKRNLANQLSTAQLAKLKAHALTLHEPQRSYSLEDLGLLEKWYAYQVPADITDLLKKRLNEIDMSALWDDVSRRPMLERNRKQEMAYLKRDADEHINNHAKARQEEVDAHQAQASADWEAKYKPKLDPELITKLRKNYQTKLATQVDTLVEKRTKPLLQWLHAPLFNATLEDYDPAHIHDGIKFEGMVGQAISGINASPSGRSAIEGWIKKDLAVKDSLIWRTIALNQTAAITDLETAIKLADKHHVEVTPLKAYDFAGLMLKTVKGLADTYKKAQGIANANATADLGNDKVFNVTLKANHSFVFDNIAITCGDAIFKRFKVDKLGDFVSEKIVQHLFCLRSFVEAEESLKLIEAQAVNEGLARSQILGRLKAEKAFLVNSTAEFKTKQIENLTAAWDEFKTKNAKGASALKDARLAIVVGLIEIVNFHKLTIELGVKRDGKTAAALAVSGMSIVSAVLDVASQPIKNILGKESFSYQKIKLWGGVLSGVGTLITAGFDFKDAGDKKKDGYTLISILYYTKSALGAAGGVATLITAYTYSGTLMIRMFGGRAATELALAGAGRAGAFFVARRIFLFCASGWVTVVTIVVQVIIWKVSPNELEEWCSNCSLGKKRGDKGYDTAKDQQDALLKAVAIVS